MRYSKIQAERNVMLLFEKALQDSGYVRVPDSTGGDHDFIVIDEDKKEYIWCENGFGPFCLDIDYLNKKYKSSSLKKMDKSRH